MIGRPGLASAPPRRSNATQLSPAELLRTDTDRGSLCSLPGPWEHLGMMVAFSAVGMGLQALNVSEKAKMEERLMVQRLRNQKILPIPGAGGAAAEEAGGEDY